EVLDKACAQRCDDRLDLLVSEHLVRARLLDVQDLATERQDRLEAAVAAFLGAAAGGRALDEVQLTDLRIALGAVGELAGQDAVVHEALLDDEVAGFTGGIAGALSRQARLDDPPGV